MMIMSISDEHLLLTSRITEGKRNNKNRKKEETSRNTKPTTDFQPLHNQCWCSIENVWL